MALSGRLTVMGPTISGGRRDYYIDWTATQNVSTNASTINWTLGCSGTGTDWTGLAERTGIATIAGKTVWNKSERILRQPGTITSGSLVVKHDANGNASFSASMTVSIYDADWLYSNSATFTLDRIYRGIVYIYDGTSFKEHACYIYNGSTWDMYQPYIYTGSGWEMY